MSQMQNCKILSVCRLVQLLPGASSRKPALKEIIASGNTSCCCLLELGSFLPLVHTDHRITALQESRTPELEPPFRPREKLLELQRHFQNVHKHTYLKGRYDAVTSVGIPLALAASSMFLIGRGVYNMSHGIGKKE